MSVAVVSHADPGFEQSVKLQRRLAATVREKTKSSRTKLLRHDSVATDQSNPKRRAERFP